VYRNQYFELDVFEKKDPITKLPLILLEIELTDKQQEVTLPSWIPIIREVTCEEAYTNYCLAKTFD
jgi:CYTH domain-containing protein